MGEADQMRWHDLRMALVAVVAFGPVVLAAAYGVAHASKLDAAAPMAAPTVVSALAPVVSAPALVASAPAPVRQGAPTAANTHDKPKKFIHASVNRVRPKHLKASVAQ
jgi:hypothetical protein